MLALWIVIGALALVALICVVAILIGQFGTVLSNTMMTVVALAAFAFLAWLETTSADRRPMWQTAGAVGLWTLVLLLWVVKIWLPYAGASAGDDGGLRFMQALGIAIVARLAFLYAVIMLKAYERYGVSALASILTIVAIALTVLEAILLIVPLMVAQWVNFGEFYGKLVLATLVLAAVATAMVPLVRLAVRRSGRFTIPEPTRRWGSSVAPTGAATESAGVPASIDGSADEAQSSDSSTLLPWPRFADGTPRPMLPNGQPDFDAVDHSQSGTSRAPSDG